MDASQHYTVLARRFRPQAFDDVVGQEHVAQALKNAIRSDRVAHAYLFTGARGVGKTSTARIFAKAMNCPDVKDGVPCNVCDTCEAIAAGSDVDVLEIDGASNRGIDDIRQLRANVSVKSMRSRCKVYIIDEVHMLTKEAFNALLKTLEEPPPNVKFVFCTTEPNKVPDTILSRCQRFDFSTIATGRIAERLTEIALSEERTVEPAAVELVARRAAGSMRDSQSLFDQLLAFGGETITPEDVHRLLGTADDDRLIEVARTLHDRRADLALGVLDAALGEGVQLGELLDQVLSLFRDLMIVASGANEVTLLAVAEDQRPVLTEIASDWGLPTIVAAMQILAEAKARTDRVNYARALIELALVRVASLEDLSSVSQLVAAVRDGAPLNVNVIQAQSASGGRQPPVRTAPPTAIQQDVGQAVPDVSPPQHPTPTPSEPPQPTPAPQVTPDPSIETVPSIGTEQGADAPRSPGEPTVERISFQPGSESRILTELKTHIEDATSMQLDLLTWSAIIGPNRIELVFPTSYDLAKSYCEQLAVQSRIVGLLSEIAGQPVSVSFRLVAVEREPVTVESRPIRGRDAVDKPPERAGDQFAARVQDLFSATILKVEDAPATSASDEGEESSDEAD